MLNRNNKILAIFSLVLLFTLDYLKFLDFFDLSVSRGSECSLFRNAQEIAEDDVCFPSFLTFPSPTYLIANVTRDVETFKTRHWRSPEDCIDGKAMWENIRNSPAVVKQFSNVLVWKQYPNVYFKGPNVFSVSHRCNSWDETPMYLSWIIPVLNTKTFRHGYLDASQYWGGEFYHMMEEKGFLLGAARILLNQYPDMVIITESRFPKLLEFANDILGIPSHRFYAISTTIIRVHGLYVPYQTDCAVQSAQHTLLTREWIRDRHPELYARKVYKQDANIVLIHRNESGVCSRCLKNSPELYMAISKAFPHRNVHMVTLGDMSFVDIASLFSKTDILIAPHGAGLVNMIFLPDGAHIIEVMNHPVRCNLCFYEMALALGLQYTAVSPFKNSKEMAEFDRVDVEQILYLITQHV